LVGAGIKTREEARAELGLGAEGGAPSKAPVARSFEKYNHNHEEQGRFAAADNVAGPVGSVAPCLLYAVNNRVVFGGR
jgi:hypothetical protein